MRREEGGRERENMIRRLYEASVSGNLLDLNALIEEDELILNRAMITSFNETPLHIAAMSGHFDFAREILKRKPKLATELDSESYTPLHLASAEGNLEMVKELLKIDPDVCCVTDRDGNTPLHLAAIKGRIDVMKELIQARSDQVIDLKVERGESILHLCVKYNRLEALKLLLESPCAQGLLNCKDFDGNTPLHLAAAKKLAKGIEILREKNIEVNALNANGLTALDILAQSPRDMKDMDIGESLRAAGASRARDIRSSSVILNSNDNTNAAMVGSENTFVSSRTETNQRQPPDRKRWLEEKKNSLMIVSTVIATMAFQAVLSPPGGVWQQGNKAGKSVMADRNYDNYVMFLSSNSVCFVGSLSITFLLISGLPLKRRFFMWILMVSMWIIISSLVWTYYMATSQLTPLDGELFKDLNHTMDISIEVWFVLMGFVLILHTIRWVLWFVNRFSWKGRVSIWISIALVAITIFLLTARDLSGKLEVPTSLVDILFTSFSIWFGVVGFVLLLCIARWVFRRMKKHWRLIVKHIERHKSLIDRSESSV